MFLSCGLSKLVSVKPFEVLTTPIHPLFAPSLCISRCLELHPNNLQALMALAVSLTNTGMRQDACEALLCWLRHNSKYKHLLKGKRHLAGSPGSQRGMSRVSTVGRYERCNIRTG